MLHWDVVFFDWRRYIHFTLFCDKALVLHSRHFANVYHIFKVRDVCIEQPCLGLSRSALPWCSLPLTHCKLVNFVIWYTSDITKKLRMTRRGESERLVRCLFDMARSSAPAIVFLGVLLPLYFGSWYSRRSYRSTRAIAHITTSLVFQVVICMDLLP